MQTVFQYLQKKGIKTFALANKEMIGKKVRITGNYGPGYNNGEIVEITYWGGQSNNNITSNLTCMINSAVGIYISLSHMHLITEETIKDIEESIAENNKQIASLNAEIKTLECKIKFMQENKLEKFDEDEFKVYAVLNELGKRSSQIQKAQAIAKLIKG